MDRPREADRTGDEEMNETGEAADSELQQPASLRDANIAYEQGAAGERATRDALVAA